MSASNDLPEPGTYRHYKGGYYHLAWLARREHDGEWMCCYARNGTLERYVRPASEWSEPIDSDGTLRFTPAGAGTLAPQDTGAGRINPGSDNARHPGPDEFWPSERAAFDEALRQRRMTEAKP